MFIRGVVETERVKKFDNGKVLRDVEVLETLTNGKHDKVWIQVWGENGIDTTEGAKIDVEVRMRTENFTRKDGSLGTKTKLVAVTK